MVCVRFIAMVKVQERVKRVVWARETLFGGFPELVC